LGANPFKRRRNFPLAGKRNALGFAVLSTNVAPGDAVKGVRHDRFARGPVPIKNLRRAEVKALQVAEASLGVKGGKPRKPLSSTANYRHRLFS
jgi:hypothetical protein